MISAVAYTLDVTQVLNLEWKWWSLVFVVILVGILISIIIDQYKLNIKLLNDRPSITVRPKKENDDYYLEVENRGYRAKFECQIKIANSNELHLGYWELAKSSESFITHIDKVKIAHCTTTIYPRGGQSRISSSITLYLYYIEKSSTQLVCWENKSWTPDIVNAVKPEWFLNITITSTPPLKEGKFVKDYRLDLNGLMEITPQSISHKGEFWKGKGIE